MYIPYILIYSVVQIALASILTVAPAAHTVGFIWRSTDDGDTWTDETGDYTSMSGGIAQWYGGTTGSGDNMLYISSLGQGISAKTFKED